MTCFGGCFARLVHGREQRKRFLEAAKHGDEVGSMMNNNPTVVNSTTFLARKNALHLAAEEGHITVLSSILEALLCQASMGGTSDVAAQIAELINSQDNEGRTPLLMACAHGHVECARFLLANGARRAVADVRGNTPVHYAAAKGHLGILFMLLGEFLDELSEQQAADDAAGVPQPHGMDPGRRGDGSGYERGPGSGGNGMGTGVGGGGGVESVSSSLRGSYMVSGMAGTVAGESAIDALLPGGSSERPEVVRLADARNAAGFSPLHFAVWAKQSAAVQVLLQHGADLLAKNLRSGADSSIPCPGGCTPLHLAAMRGHVEISRILLKTYCERVLEPMQVQAGTGPAAAALARSLVALDPRTQHNAAGHVPYQVAQRMGYVSLSVLLRPNIPLMRLFSDEERATRFYGPPPLAVLAAEALNRKLLAALDSLPQAVVQPPPLRPAATAAQAPATAAQQLAAHAAGLAPSGGSRVLNHVSGLPTVQEVEEDGARTSPRQAATAAVTAVAAAGSVGFVAPATLAPVGPTPVPDPRASSASGGEASSISSPGASAVAVAISPPAASPGSAGVAPAGMPRIPTANEGVATGLSITVPSSPDAHNSTSAGLPQVSPFALVSGGGSGSPGRSSLAASPPGGVVVRPVSRQASARNLSQAGAGHDAATLLDGMAVVELGPPVAGQLLPGQPQGVEFESVAGDGAQQVSHAAGHVKATQQTPVLEPSNVPAEPSSAPRTGGVTGGVPAAPSSSSSSPTLLVPRRPPPALPCSAASSSTAQPQGSGGSVEPAAASRQVLPAAAASPFAAPALVAAPATPPAVAGSAVAAAVAGATGSSGLSPRDLTTPSPTCSTATASAPLGLGLPAALPTHQPHTRTTTSNGGAAPAVTSPASRASALSPTRVSCSGSAAASQSSFTPPVPVPAVGTALSPGAAGGLVSQFGTPLPGSPVPGAMLSSSPLQQQHSGTLQHQHSGIANGLPPGVVALARGSSITLLGAAAAAHRLSLAPAQSLPQVLAVAAEDVITPPDARGLPGCLSHFENSTSHTHSLAPGLLPPDLDLSTWDGCSSPVHTLDGGGSQPGGNAAAGNAQLQLRHTGSGALLPLLPGAAALGVAGGSEPGPSGGFGARAGAARPGFASCSGDASSPAQGLQRQVSQNGGFLQRQPSGGILIHVGPGAQGDQYSNNCQRASASLPRPRSSHGLSLLSCAASGNLQAAAGFGAVGSAGAGAGVGSPGALSNWQQQEFSSTGSTRGTGSTGQVPEGVLGAAGGSTSSMPIRTLDAGRMAEPVLEDGVVAGAVLASAAERNGTPVLEPAAVYDEEEDECGVCMEHPALVLIQPCMHAVCGPCAHKMCSLNLQRSPHCPFCRGIISNFSAGKSVLIV